MCHDRPMLATQASPAADRESLLRAFVGSLDEREMARRYSEDGGVVVLPAPIPEPLLGEMIAEARALLPRAVRIHAPFVRKAGAVAHPTIVREAPALHALHRSPELLAVFERVTGTPLDHRDAAEAHASALYTYTKGGDFMDWHYDECGCEPGDSFSTIVGLVDDTESRLEIETRRDEPGGPLTRSMRTRPGTFAFFCGTRAYHRVTPLREGETRITFAFTYVRRGRRPGGIYAARMKLGNALVYFGLSHLFERPRGAS